MASISDILVPVQTYSVPDREVSAQSGVTDYQVPPDTFRPRTFVIFDFLRRATATAEELLAGKQFTLENLPPTDLLATQRAADRLDLFVQNLWRYAAAVGLDESLPFLGTLPPRPSSFDDKVNLANAVLENLRGPVNIETDSQGISTMTASFSVPRPIGKAKSSADRPRDTGDKDLLWINLFSPAAKDFTHLDQPLIGPMTWVYVVAQSRTDPTVWERTFTGFVNSVSRNNNRGFVSVSVTAQDVTKLLHMSQMRMNPAVADPAMQSLVGIFGSNWSIFNTPLAGMDLEQIFRFVLLGESRDPSVSKPPLGVLDYRLADEGSIASIYEAQTIQVPAAPQSDALSELTQVSKVVRERATDPRFASKLVMWGINDLVPYRAMLPTTTPNFFSCTVVNRFEVLRDVVHRCMCEFFAGPDGNFYVHPFRHAQAFLGAHVVLNGQPVPQKATRWNRKVSVTDAYVIDEDEILTDSEVIDDSQIVTILALTGETPGIGELGVTDFLSLRVGVGAPDYLVSRFGFRYREVVEPLVNTANQDLLALFAYARMAYINKDAYNGQFTIFYRPELKVARPVYFPSRRNVGYVMNITHDVQSRDQAVTRISVAFLRKVDAATIDFTEWLVQNRQTFTATDPASIKALTNQFLSAAGFGKDQGPVIFAAQRPGSALGSPTTLEVNRIAAETQDGSESVADFVSRIKEAQSLKALEDQLTGG